MKLFMLRTSCLLVLLVPSLSSAQNVCGTPPPTAPAGNPKQLNVVLLDHNTLSADKTPITTDYTLEAVLGTTVAATTTIPKSAFTAVSGTPANCYSVAFPTLVVSQGNIYSVRLKANGPFGSSMLGVSSNGFFIQAAPRDPESLRLTVFNMLSKAWLRVLSTVDSKPWFKPIGR